MQQKHLLFETRPTEPACGMKFYRKRASIMDGDFHISDGNMIHFSRGDAINKYQSWPPTEESVCWRYMETGRKWMHFMHLPHAWVMQCVLFYVPLLGQAQRFDSVGSWLLAEWQATCASVFEPVSSHGKEKWANSDEQSPRRAQPWSSCLLKTEQRLGAVSHLNDRLSLRNEEPQAFIRFYHMKSGFWGTKTANETSQEGDFVYFFLESFK